MVWRLGHYFGKENLCLQILSWKMGLQHWSATFRSRIMSVGQKISITMIWHSHTKEKKDYLLHIRLELLPLSQTHWFMLLSPLWISLGHLPSLLSELSQIPACLAKTMLKLLTEGMVSYATPQAKQGPFLELPKKSYCQNRKALQLGFTNRI